MDATLAPEAADTARTARPMQRARGVGRLAVGAHGVRRLYQEGSAQIRILRGSGREGLDAVLINTAGGLTGGDRFNWDVEVGEGAHCRVITQACEKIYRAVDEPAEATIALQVDEGARLDWIPQETILFDRAALVRRLEAELAPNAVLLLVEAVILGRTAMGETVTGGSFRDRWRVRRGGRLIFADEVRLHGDVADIAAAPVILGGARAFATLALFDAEAEPLVEPLRRLLGRSGGVSFFDGKLIARIVAADGAALRRLLLPAIALASGGRPPPRVWTN